jgi:Putative DNA-binding domain
MDLRETYEAMSLDTIDSFVADGREEDLYLDFKTITGPLSSKDDRKNYAKAVSGFANSDGGLIVWGVDARPNADGVDCACGKPGIAGLKKFIAKLNEYTGSVAGPPLPGVIHKAIPSKDVPDHGFAVTLVPASDEGPHMAKLGEDRYYRRSGASFLKMEHFEIADMFGRRPHPDLLLTHRALPPEDWGASFRYTIILAIENRGRGSARAPYLGLKVVPHFGIAGEGIDGNRNYGLPKLVSAGDSLVRFGGSGDVFIHPGTVLPITKIACATPKTAAPPGAVVEFELCCENHPLKTGKLQLPGSLFREAAG